MSGDDSMSLRTKLAAYFLYLMQDTPHHGIDIPILKILEWASIAYKKGVAMTYHSYQQNPQKQVKLPAKVISLGNITVGGTGKTPMACLLARYLQQKGFRTALLNRGYRSEKEDKAAIMSDGEHILLTAAVGGDEACLMARSLPGIPVLVGRKRSSSGQMAVDMFHSQVLLLDDGFQHWQLHRDLDIVLIDGTNPFGNGYMLPRGILREPLDQLRRAGLIIITKADLAAEQQRESIYAVLRRYHLHVPVAEAVHRPKWCISFSDWNSFRKRTDCDTLPNSQHVIAVSALGNPASFEATIQAFGYTIVDTIRYDDHHQYSQDDLDAMTKKAQEQGAVLVTTEKDAVKMDAAYITAHSIPLYVLGIEIEIIKGKTDIENVLAHVVGG